MKVAKELPEASPIRLGLALNFSVFFYEIRSNSTRACELAQEVCVLLLHVCYVYNKCLEFSLFKSCKLLG